MKINVPLARDVIMLALGSVGMTHELFFIHEPNLVRVWVCIGLLLGPAALQAAWRIRNPLPEHGSITSTDAGSASSPSPLLPPGS